MSRPGMRIRVIAVATLFCLPPLLLFFFLSLSLFSLSPPSDSSYSFLLFLLLLLLLLFFVLLIVFFLLPPFLPFACCFYFIQAVLLPAYKQNKQESRCTSICLVPTRQPGNKHRKTNPIGPNAIRDASRSGALVGWVVRPAISRQQCIQSNEQYLLFRTRAPTRTTSSSVKSPIR